MGARVLRTTMANVMFRRSDERTKALRDTMFPVLGMEEPDDRVVGVARLAEVDRDETLANDAPGDEEGE